MRKNKSIKNINYTRVSEGDGERKRERERENGWKVHQTKWKVTSSSFLFIKITKVVKNSLRQLHLFYYLIMHSILAYKQQPNITAAFMLKYIKRYMKNEITVFLFRKMLQFTFI